MSVPYERITELVVSARKDLFHDWTDLCIYTLWNLKRLLKETGYPDYEFGVMVKQQVIDPYLAAFEFGSGRDNPPKRAVSTQLADVWTGFLARLRYINVTKIATRFDLDATAYFKKLNEWDNWVKRHPQLQ